MRIATAALIALAVSPAAADTGMSIGGSCEVRFVRAPDDVRHTIESWLANEPSCVTSIELRVVPTDDGYYLLAQRPDGRIHERVVPDAQSAGVLVASWVADDWVTEPPPPPPRAPLPIIVNPFADEPGRDLGVRAEGSGGAPRRWLSLAALIRAGGGGGSGLRVEVDVMRRGAWSLGAALSASSSTDSAWTPSGMHVQYGSDDLKAIAVLARTSKLGRWELRLAGGVGVLLTESGVTDYTWSSTAAMPDRGGSFGGASGPTPVVETAFSLSRRLGTSWSITGGAVASFMHQELLTFDPYSWDSKSTLATRESELMFMGGLRYSL
jgi:hypothetical protein